MNTQDTTISLPTSLIEIPEMMGEDNYQTGRTERGALQGRGGLARPNVFRGEDWDVSDTALACTAIFVAVSSIGTETLRSGTAQWNEFSQPEKYEAESSTDGMIGDTVDPPSKWAMASHSRKSPTYRLISRLTDLFETPEDARWPSAKWPDGSAFEDARAFIAKLPLSHVAEPEIRFANDGEINFLWTDDNVHVDLGFYGTGMYSYYGRNSSGHEIQGVEVLASQGLTQDIKHILEI